MFNLCIIRALKTSCISGVRNWNEAWLQCFSAQFVILLSSTGKQGLTTHRLYACLWGGKKNKKKCFLSLLFYKLQFFLCAAPLSAQRCQTLEFLFIYLHIICNSAYLHMVETLKKGWKRKDENNHGILTLRNRWSTASQLKRKSERRKAACRCSQLPDGWFL